MISACQSSDNKRGRPGFDSPRERFVVLHDFFGGGGCWGLSGGVDFGASEVGNFLAVFGMEDEKETGR